MGRVRVRVRDTVRVGVKFRSGSGFAVGFITILIETQGCQFRSRRYKPTDQRTPCVGYNAMFLGLGGWIAMTWLAILWNFELFTRLTI